MANLTRVVLSHSKGGAPIRAYLRRYEPNTDGYTIPILGKSLQMEEEVKKWFYDESSPPAIFIMEKYIGLTEMELFELAAKATDDRDTQTQWPLSPFWAKLVKKFDLPAKKSVTTCILGMELDDSQLPEYVVFYYKWLETVGWRTMMKAPSPEERLVAFGRLNARLKKGTIDAFTHGLEDYRFSKDQVIELKKVIVLHSKLERPGNIHNIHSLRYLHALKDRFFELSWEHRVNIRLLALLVKTPEGWAGFQKGMTKGDISFFLTGPAPSRTCGPDLGGMRGCILQ
ncbi:hypothetical protein FRB93_004001 [Tulasnella sp. JGI-2019a]|nr:hypothetical protein FRB93_004001 [Tulasnella sp. JGI-2019a]